MDFIMLFELYGEYIVAGIIFILAVVSFLVTLFTKRDVKKAINDFLEVNDLKYKTVETRVKSSQNFSEEVPDYILDEHTNELQLSPIPKNIQDFITSHIDTALERALERFSVPNAIEEDIVNDYTERVNDLSVLGDAIETAERYRDLLKLPDSYSIAQIYDAVDKSSQSLKLRLKEVQNNEKKSEVIEKSEQT